MAIRVLLVDDHAVVRAGLKMYLALEPDVEIVGEVADGLQAVERARALRPDVVLMDLLMPTLDGVAATLAIRAELPETQVIALTSVMEHEGVGRAIKAGAIGYLLKNTDADELVRAIRAAAAGQVRLSPAAAVRLAEEVRGQTSVEKLTDRETSVLRLVARGLANKEIGRALGIGEETVKTHVSSVLSKMGVQSRTQAALLAAQMGLVGDAPAS